MRDSSQPQPWYRILYVQVLLAVLAGILIGAFAPDTGKALKPLGDGFIRLVKMMIGPIVFFTVVHGIASLRDLKKLGRVGAKTLIYFELVSTLALIIGLVVVNVLRPGEGFTPPGQTFHADASGAAASHEYATKAHDTSTVGFLLNIVPNTFVGAFVSGELLQVLFLALLTAFAIAGMGERGQRLLGAIEYASEVAFGVMRILVKAAPIGALGAMAYTVGSYGLGALSKLAALMAGFYLTAALFVLLVLGSIARYAGFSILRFLGYIKHELLLVLSTSSSEVALPHMLQKLERLGCAKSTVGLVIPTGYSFNLDGTNIYMAMAALFLAQATNTELSLAQQLSLLFVAMLTSKGASGVTGAGFVTLAATLQAVPTIPLESLALLVGIDRFMSECRAITNLIGNGVATVAISRWEGEVDPASLNERLQTAGEASA
ncbi:MAG TPA: C4-dicarboxylate transporter DctA [Polyangiales bacterium]